MGRLFRYATVMLMRLSPRDKRTPSTSQFTDEELRQCFSLKLDEENLIHIDFLRQLQDEAAQKRLSELVVESILTVFQAHPQRQFFLLIDIRNIQQGAFFYLPAAEPYRRLAEHIQLEKAAALTTGTLLTPLIEMFVRSVRKDDRIRVFRREADAYRWFRSS